MSSRLDDVDLSLQIGDKKEYNKTLKKWQIRLLGLQQALRTSGHALLIAFEGWDASGKGGAIKRLTAPLDPRGFRVYSIGPPTDEEKRHHYLWRFWTHIPAVGEIVIFDRSWYGRVLVERVEGFCTKDEWQRAYREINEMEENFVDHGGGIVKFWLEIDNETQLERFRQREGDPKKQWKITTEDWRNRDRWDQYEIAVDDMLDNTSTKKAPWTVIESRDKLHARVKTIQCVLSAIDTLM